jgi:2-amino-4-hydroxy-6-hydroxymethyldihydropteridine diphosphokinase
MARVFLLLGGNQGDRLEMFTRAREEITKHVGELQCESSIYETEPWGFEDDALFLNQLLVVDTELSAEAVLETVLKIEHILGRRRTSQQWTGRSMDIDILLFDVLITQKETLSIPHPRLHLRRFALQPLNEVAGEIVHPVLNKTINTLLTECQDKQKVTLLVEKQD